MVDYGVLVGTASLYGLRAPEDDSYALARDVLNSVIRRLGLTGEQKGTEIRNSAQFVVVRMGGTSGKSPPVRHPLDLVESAIDCGVEALEIRGLLGAAHTCLIAVPRGSLSGTFTYIYEVVRRSGWSVLPLGGSVDGHDISELCRAYEVDTLFISANAIESVFASHLVGQFDCLRTVLYVEGLPTLGASELLAATFPHIQAYPFLYLSDATGPIGQPVLGAGGDTYEALDNVLVEVEVDQGEISLNGSGDIFVSILGLEQPTLIRRRTGDFGTLTTSNQGRQMIRLHRRNPSTH